MERARAGPSGGVGSLHRLLQRSTVRVTSTSSIGTGFFVAPAHIVTCAHVVKDILISENVTLQWQDQAPILGRLAKKVPDPYTQGSFPDIALIELQKELPEHPCVYLDADEDYQARDPLYSWGYTEKSPLGESITPNSEGEGRRASSPDTWLIKFRAAQTMSGLSGSPLLNDRTGRVCGMIKISRDDESDLGGWAIRSGVILDYFPELKGLQESFHNNNPRWRSAQTTTYGSRVVTKTLAMLFVDIMRMLYVSSSDVARQYNSARYGEFIDIADQHRDDYRSRKATFSNAFDQSFNERLDNLEVRLSWMLGRLRVLARDSSPNVGANAHGYFTKMRDFADQLHEIGSMAAGDGYDRIVDNVKDALRILETSRAGTDVQSLDAVSSLRLSTQSRLLKGRSICSIVEDMDHDFAITYFVLDRELLSYAQAASG